MGKASNKMAVMPMVLEDYSTRNSPVRITTPADPEKVKAWHESDEYKKEQRRINSWKNKHKRAFRVKRT